MTSAAEPNDEALMLALQRGEELALNRLMARWERPLRSFLYRSTRNEADALDLAQETFVRIYRHRARYRPGAKFSTWMFQIALNLARDHARRLHRRPTDPLEDESQLVSPDNPRAGITAEETALAVRAAVASLPEDLREAVLLAEFEELSHAEIAEIVDATPKAIETRLYRAREKLRAQLTRFLKD